MGFLLHTPEGVCLSNRKYVKISIRGIPPAHSLACTSFCGQHLPIFLFQSHAFSVTLVHLQTIVLGCNSHDRRIALHSCLASMKIGHSSITLPTLRNEMQHDQSLSLSSSSSSKSGGSAGRCLA